MSVSSRFHSITTFQREITKTCLTYNHPVKDSPDKGVTVSWVKVCCFLDMVGSQELYSSLLLASSSSLRGPFPFHPLSIDAERWQVGVKVIKQVLSLIQPTSDSEKRRREIINYLQKLIENFSGIKVFPFGSVPLKTYLPHGDVDLTVVSRYHTSQDLAADIHNLLKSEMMNNTKVEVKDVLYVPAQIKVVKCTVSDIAVDISFNQTAGLSALCFLEQVDQYMGKDHLFKRSVVLIKAWCYYESRLLGGYYGLMSTYALETLVLHVINHFHRSLHCPLAVLYKFLEYYCMFDWERYCVAINGLVSLSSLPEIKVYPPLDSDEILLTDNFVRGFKETFLSSDGAIRRAKEPAFPVKFLNIMDPLRDDNNLGRCVSKANFFRVRSAFDYGSEKMTEIFMLPHEKIAKELELFFVNTLDRNGKGSRADVLVHVPEYGVKGSKTPSANEGIEDLLTGIEYDLWFDDYGIVSPANPRVWGNQWVELGHKMQFDKSIYYDIDESLPYSNNTPKSLQLTNSAFDEDKGKSKGTGAYIPRLGQAGYQRGFGHNCRTDVQLQNHHTAAIQVVVNSWCTRVRNPFRCCHFLTKLPHCGTLADYLPEGNAKEEEEYGMNSKTEEVQFHGIITPNEDESCVVNYTIEDFPTLPGSQPIPTKLNFAQPETRKSEEVDDTYSIEAVENEKFNCVSPRSVTLSESEKQLTALELKDAREFPPLKSTQQPLQYLMRFNKKEFPPLGKNVKNLSRKKDLKQVVKSGASDLFT